LANKTIDELIEDLKQESMEARMFAIDEIKKMGKQGKKAMNALREQLQVENTQLKMRAIEALSLYEQDAKAVLPDLENLAEKGDKKIRKAANNAIKKIKG
jgi:HEAT repeat protein